jgi:hypothetical protein
MSNVDDLEAAGVLESNKLNRSQKDTINSLTPAQIEVLKEVRELVGAPDSSQTGGRPWLL